jgi:hypothetical protein
MVATLDSIHVQRWTAFLPESEVGQFVRGNAIPDFFAAHPEIGSPLGAEVDWDEVKGGRIQAFSGGIVGWDPDGGARVVSG